MKPASDLLLPSELPPISTLYPAYVVFARQVAVCAFLLIRAVSGELHRGKNTLWAFVAHVAPTPPKLSIHLTACCIRSDEPESEVKGSLSASVGMKHSILLPINFRTSPSVMARKPCVFIPGGGHLNSHYVIYSLQQECQFPRPGICCFLLVHRIPRVWDQFVTCRMALLPQTRLLVSGAKIFRLISKIQI